VNKPVSDPGHISPRNSRIFAPHFLRNTFRCFSHYLDAFYQSYDGFLIFGELPEALAFNEILSISHVTQDVLKEVSTVQLLQT
jgi:hypothetical protein